MGTLHQMGKNQPLPVAVKQVFAAVHTVFDATAPGQRLQKQMYLGIMAQGLKMTYAFHRCGDRFAVKDAPGIKADMKIKALLDKFT